MVSGFGLMALLYLLFAKFVPMISIWEFKVGLQPHGGGIFTTAVPVVSLMAWCWKGLCPRMWRNESPLRPLRRSGDGPGAVDALNAASSELKFDPAQIVIVSGEPHEGYDFADSH